MNWSVVFRGESVRRIALPTYPFERERYWITDGFEPRLHEAALRWSSAAHELPERAADVVLDESVVEAESLWDADPGESRLAALERTVRKEAARVLGMRRGELPGARARLTDLGMDSLMGVVLRNRLQEIVGRDLAPTFAFEYQTPAEMAGALDLLLWSSGAMDDELSATERDEIQI